MKSVLSGAPFGAITAFLCVLFFSTSAVSGGTGDVFEDRYWQSVSMPHRRTLSSTLDENVREVLVKEGDTVKRGDILLQLDSREIDAQIAVARVQADFKARIEAAREEYELAQREYARAESLGDGISSSELDRYRTRMRLAQLELEERERSAELARRQLALYESRARAYQIFAPFDGVVSRVWIEEGEMATAGQRIIEMADLSNVEIRVHLPERHVADVRGGQDVEVRFLYGGEEVVSGSVDFVSPYVDSASGTFLVRARAEAGGSFLPGMACEIRFLPGEK